MESLLASQSTSISSSESTNLENGPGYGGVNPGTYSPCANRNLWSEDEEE